LGCADGIVLLPGLGADVVTRRPRLVECFGRFGFVPDYECDLTELDSAALCLRPPPRKADAELVSAVETTFARLNSQLDALRRALGARTSELAAADRHIATVEEKLLKVKQYHRELKLLKEQKQALRKSPERRIGQILLAPYRLPEKLLRQILKRIRGGVKSTRTAVPVSAYQKWLQEHCASPEQIQMMRDTWHGFTSKPLDFLLFSDFAVIVTYINLFTLLMVGPIANSLAKIDPALIEAAQTLGASGWKIVRSVVIPASVTDIYTDMRILLGWAWTYLIVAEVVGTMSGITFFINQQARYRNFDNVYAAIGMIGIIGLSTDMLLAWLGTILFPWKRKSNRTKNNKSWFPLLERKTVKPAATPQPEVESHVVQ